MRKLSKKLFHQVSTIQLKSGKITNNVGKSVNLFAISSNCLVTQFIIKSGNAETLCIETSTTSEKFQSFKAWKSTSTELASSQLSQIFTNGQFGKS